MPLAPGPSKTSKYVFRTTDFLLGCLTANNTSILSSLRNPYIFPRISLGAALLRRLLDAWRALRDFKVHHLPVRCLIRRASGLPAKKRSVASPIHRRLISKPTASHSRLAAGARCASLCVHPSRSSPSLHAFLGAAPRSCIAPSLTHLDLATASLAPSVSATTLSSSSIRSSPSPNTPRIASLSILRLITSTCILIHCLAHFR